MGWVTISLRKMALKQRVSNLQYRLLQISQERQSVANQSQYTQRYLNAMKNQQYSGISDSYMAAVQAAQNGAANLDPTSSDWSNYQTSLDQLALVQSRQQMAADSVFQSLEDSILGDVNRRDQQLEAEQTQIETQLQAAQAELESLDQAMDDSIKSSAIKLS